MNYIKKYHDRLLMHKAFVEHFYEIAKKSDDIITYPEIDFNIRCHDDDKLRPDIMAIQARRMIEDPNYDFHTDKEVVQVMLDHVNYQPHHPQYWNPVNVTNPFNEPVVCTSMPYTYLLEMACDWMAMAKEKHEGPFDWYNKTVGTAFIFDEMQCKYLRKMLAILGQELINS